jgi:hypothetical protein
MSKAHRVSRKCRQSSLEMQVLLSGFPLYYLDGLAWWQVCSPLELEQMRKKVDQQVIQALGQITQTLIELTKRKETTELALSKYTRDRIDLRYTLEFVAKLVAEPEEAGTHLATETKPIGLVQAKAWAMVQSQALERSAEEHLLSIQEEREASHKAEVREFIRFCKASGSYLKFLFALPWKLGMSNLRSFFKPYKKTPEGTESSYTKFFEAYLARAFPKEAE